MNQPSPTKATRFRDSRAIRIGSILLVFGSGPLLLIILAANLGLTRDPNPNPVLFGIMAGLTFWPGVILMIVGIASVRSARKRAQSGSQD